MPSIRKIRNEAIRREQERAKREAEELAKQNPNLVRPETPAPPQPAPPPTRGGKKQKNPNDPLKYVPRDLDVKPRRKETAATFKEFGIQTWRDLFIDWNFPVNSPNFRAEGFDSPEDLLKRWAGNIGANVIAAGGLRILYNPLDGRYYAYVEIDSDPYSGS